MNRLWENLYLYVYVICNYKHEKLINSIFPTLSARKTELTSVFLIFVWLAPTQCFTYSRYLVNSCWDT